MLLDSQKEIIKKAVEQDLALPHFINKKFVGALGGWEVEIDDKSFRRFVISRKESRGDLIHIINIQDFWIGNPPKGKEGQNQGIQISLQNLKNIESFTLHDWLDVHPNLGKADQYVIGIIKFIADDLINLEMEAHKKEFLASL